MKTWGKKISVYIFFMFLSVFFVFFLYKTRQLGIDSDGSFHFSRVEEIYQNLKAGELFTFIATHTFHNSGVGSFLFYPTVFLYPWACLRFFLDPITSFYVWYGLFMFLTLSIAYYSMYGFSRSKLRALMFALFYTIAIYHLYLGVRNYVLGEFIAYTFVPLALYGFYEVIWGDHKKWPLLGIGVALLLYSHLISVVITVILMFVLFTSKLVVDIKFPKVRWMALFKSIGLALILSLWIIYPFFTDFMHTKLGTPSFGFAFLYSMQDLWAASLENHATNRGVGIIFLMAALSGWYFVRNKKQEFWIYILGLIFIALSTNLFPYTELARIDGLFFLGMIQFPYRFLTYASLFMATTLSLIFERVFNKFQAHKKMLFFCVLGVMMCLYIQTLTPVLDRIYDATPEARLKKGNITDPVPAGAILDKDNYYDMYTYRVLYGETDYYPKASFDGNVTTPDSNVQKKILDRSQSIMLHKAKIANKDITIDPSVAPNELVYQVKLQRSALVDLPVVNYPSEKVYVNGKEFPYSVSDRGTVQVKLAQGKNHVVVRYVMKQTYYILCGIAVITWVVIGITTLLKNIKKVETNRGSRN